VKSDLALFHCTSNSTNLKCLCHRPGPWISGSYTITHTDLEVAFRKLSDSLGCQKKSKFQLLLYSNNSYLTVGLGSVYKVCLFLETEVEINSVFARPHCHHETQEGLAVGKSSGRTRRDVKLHGGGFITVNVLL